MSLYKRGNNWHYDFALDGERFRGSTKESVYSRARKVESLLIAEARERGQTFLRKRAPVLSEFAKRFFQWVENCSLEKNTKRYYRFGWKQIQATPLRGMALNRITSDEVDSIRLEGSPAYRNQALRTLRRMLGKAFEWGIVKVLPRIRLAKESHRETLIDSEAELKLITLSSQPLRDVLLIMLDTGMRPQEVFRMRWEDVNWERRTIFIPIGKTRNSRRYVPISNRVHDALVLRFGSVSSDWVFPSESCSGHLTTVAKAFTTVREQAGLPKALVLYCARHTFATHALEATGNLAAVMKALGHSNAQTAMIYQHPGLEAIRFAVNEKNTANVERHNLRHNAIALQ